MPTTLTIRNASIHWNTGKNKPDNAGRRLDNGAENLAYPWPQKVGLANGLLDLALPTK